MNPCLLKSLSVAIFSVAAAVLSAVDIGAPFGDVELVDEIDCAKDATHEFSQWPDNDATKVETIFGRECRVMPAKGTNRYFSYVLGKGKQLKGGQPYVLVIEYPEDKPRAFAILNQGAETIIGLATGPTLGDSLFPNFVGRTAESVNYPLSGKYETARQFFNLHDRMPEGFNSGDRTRTPEDGVRVIFAQYSPGQDPANNGTAVSRIALYRVPDPSKLKAAINYPPADLPRRHIFWREEMSDGVAKGKANDAVLNMTDWYRYKINLMRLLAINTCTKDLLEFGHNQGWSSEKYGGNDWWLQPQSPHLWEEIVAEVGKDKDLYVLPYYEYAGSLNGRNSYGGKCLALNVNGEKKYTHIGWSGAPKGNVDFADSGVIRDAEQLLDCTITEFKDKANFLGAWFRPRPEANPISFNDQDIALYNREMNKNTTRALLAQDKTAEKEYCRWFLGKRRAWILAMRDYLRRNVNPDAVVFYTTDPSEEGVSIGGEVMTDDPSAWKALLNNADVKARLISDKSKGNDARKASATMPIPLAGKKHAAAVESWKGTWGKWRWDLACPPADPESLKNDDGVGFSYTFHRLYSVDDPDGMEKFRTKNGLFMVRHYCLNEHNFNVKLKGKDVKPLGYWCVQFDRAGKYSMLTEARALVNGDPRYLGYLAPLSMNRLFPEYARAFNQAFLALPAVPSVRLNDCASDGNIGVREYKTAKYGTYYAVANLGLKDLNGVEVKFPASGTVENLVSGRMIPVKDGKISLDFYAGQVYALRVR